MRRTCLEIFISLFVPEFGVPSKNQEFESYVEESIKEEKRG